MSRPCTVCLHPSVAEIDSLLLSQTSLREISTRFGFSKSAVARHSAEHISSALLKSKHIEEVADADAIFAELQRLRAQVNAILEQAEKNPAIALNAAKELRALLQLQSELEGRLMQRRTLEISGSVGNVPDAVAHEIERERDYFVDFVQRFVSAHIDDFLRDVPASPHIDALVKRKPKPPQLPSLRAAAIDI